MSDLYTWQKIKNKDISRTEQLLRDMENYCVTACGRFLESLRSNTAVGQIWKLTGKKGDIRALLINSRSTLLPVLCGIRETPEPRFLKDLIRTKKIHSVQGTKEEVLVIEKEMEKMGKAVSDIFDYDLMSLDNMPVENTKFLNTLNFSLRVPNLTDLDKIAELQGAYEREEVLPRGSFFCPTTSRINIAKIISKGQILAAEINGQLVGKINVSAVSFTRYLVGGVYVHPDFRGRGIARRMASEFISSLIGENRGVTLFVKKNNLAARRLYAGLGFTVHDDYRITYY